MAQDELSRRHFLQGVLAVVPTAVLASTCGQVERGPVTEAGPPGGTSPSPVESGTLQPTPACTDDDETPDQTEGPFFTPNSPERTSIAPAGAGGSALVVSGLVLATDCKPVARALVDFWQAGPDGEYDNDGFNFRGHQFTDANGIYRLQTRLPGLYPGRTRHIHVKVQRQGGRVLTTQLYFPGESRNASDGIFHEDLVMNVSGNAATFNFVLA